MDNEERQQDAPWHISYSKVQKAKEECSEVFARLNLTLAEMELTTGELNDRINAEMDIREYGMSEEEKFSREEKIVMAAAVFVILFALWTLMH